MPITVEAAEPVAHDAGCDAGIPAFAEMIGPGNRQVLDEIDISSSLPEPFLLFLQPSVLRVCVFLSR